VELLLPRRRLVFPCQASWIRGRLRSICTLTLANLLGRSGRLCGPVRPVQLLSQSRWWQDIDDDILNPSVNKEWYWRGERRLWRVNSKFVHSPEITFILPWVLLPSSSATNIKYVFLKTIKLSLKFAPNLSASNQSNKLVLFGPYHSPGRPILGQIPMLRRAWRWLNPSVKADRTTR
jgi:hypothetical protein